jgi:tetratricopeptide (TPR) repeat protein
MWRGVRTSKALIILLAVVAVMGAQGSVPIEVVYGRGRNKTAMKLCQDAETQLKNGDVEGAHRNVEAALRSDPTLYPALYNRAKVFIRQHKYELAIQDCTAAVKQDTAFVEAALLRASANAKLGRYAASLKEVEHVISIRPRIDGLARAMAERAWLRATCPDPSFRNGRQAINDATAACKLLEWKDEDTIDTLAAAYAEAGDFDSAVRYEQEALGTKGISAEDSKIFRYHLELFKQHQPYRETATR